MNELIKSGAVCLMMSMMAGYAFADEAKVAPPKEENKPQDIITAIIAETKLSDDGSISYEEYKAARETVIKKRLEEMKAAREKRDKEKFLALDKNKDGKVSKTELLELQKQLSRGPNGRFGRGQKGDHQGPQGMRHQGMRPGMGEGNEQRFGMGKGRGPQDENCNMSCENNGPRPGMDKDNEKCGMNCENNGPRHGMKGQRPEFGKDQKRGGDRPGMRGQGRPGLEMIMIEADKDKDGSFSKEEVKAAVLEFFDKLDVNKDGKLDKSELPGGRHGRHGGKGMNAPEKDTKEISPQVDKTE